MFDISNSLIIRELNVIFTLVSSRGPEIRTGCTWDRFDDDGALCIVRRNNCKNLPTLLMEKRASQGALFCGFVVSCLEPECITYEGRGYMSFLWRA